jgi:AcrR family transcriptional regulator
MNMIHEPPPAAAPARERRRRETRERIVDAAQRLLIEEGTEALTMQRLARELGYAVGAAYRYFASKDEVLAAVQGRFVGTVHQDLLDEQVRLAAHLKRCRVDPATTALLRLLVVSRSYASLPSRRPAEYRLICRVLGDPRALAETKLAAERMLPPVLELVQTVSLLFAEAASAGALAPGKAEQRAVVLWGSLQGVMQLRKLERFAVPAFAHAELTATTVHTLLSGWGADPAQLKEARKRAARFERPKETT